RRKPYSVILLDEIEKAHSDVFNILLQVLDDGRLTDNKGRTVDFKNTILIMTSNAGSAIIQDNLSRLNDKNREELLEKTRIEVLETLKNSVRPEFLNRIDEIIMFHPLTMDNMRDILKLQISGIKKLLEEKGLELQFTDYAMKYLCNKGYDPSYGARPIKRLLQKELVNELAKALLKGTLNKEKPIIVDFFEDLLVFRN
ncbi:MAG: AAA family ATPase, partial [Bacteroidales bacterium]|nr:AAA family ATPase [Bacteroidales bacterium]